MPFRTSTHLASISVLLLLNAAFRFAFARSFPDSPLALILNPKITETMDRVLATAPLSLLWPLEYEPGRFYWPPTLIVPLHALYELFSPFTVSLITSSLLIVTGAIACWILFRSVLAGFVFGWLWIFGTQLTYAYTIGNLLALYIVLSYALVNLVVASPLLVTGDGSRWRYWLFAATLVVVALSSEMWLNYAVFLVVASAYGLGWARHHRRPITGSAWVLAVTVLVLAAYLLVRLRVASQYMTPGAEEELVFTYSSPSLMIADVIGNYFTFLYTALSNFLPPALAAGTALLTHPPEALVREQHGYEQAFSHLVSANYVLFWRYCAGIAATVFAYFAARSIRKSWRSASAADALVVIFVLMIAVGFSTHLLIKFRPYNAVPALPYKAIVSILGVSLLVPSLLLMARGRMRAFRYRLLVAAVLGVVLVGGFTRPRMLSTQLELVGLRGYSDPIGDTLRFLTPRIRALKRMF